MEKGGKDTKKKKKKKKKIPQIKGSYPTTSSQSIIHKIIQRNILISNEEFFFDNYHNSYNTWIKINPSNSNLLPFKI